MATIATKVPDAVARSVRRKAKAIGKTPSQVARELLEEWAAPPSQDWAKALLELPRLDRSKRRRRPANVDELTWAIDTMDP